MDDIGHIYIADTNNHRIQKFSREGTFLNAWGSEGSEEDQFQSPSGVAIDRKGSLYAADKDNHRIQKFISEGTLLNEWGHKGSEEGQLSSPKGIAVDNRYIYIADSTNNCIQIFTHKGLFIAQFGTAGSEPAQMSHPTGLCVSIRGNIYIADSDNNRIQIFHYIPEIAFSTGLNIVGFTVNIPQDYNSYNLMSDLGKEDEIHKIQRYDNETHTYKATFYKNGAISADKFTLARGEGYFIYMRVGKYIFINKEVETTAFSLHPGLNIITFPYTSSYTSYDLLSYLGSPEEIVGIQRYNSKRGFFETTDYFNGKPSGMNFNIVNGEAYLIHMRETKHIDYPP